MSEHVRIVVDQFDLARQEIDGWRGRCLDVFSRCEAAVASTLLAARASGRSTKLDHLAGQRLTELGDLAEAKTGTARQAATFRKVLDGWRQIEAKRAFLAHGVATELVDRHAQWCVRLDMIVCEKGEPRPDRWTVSKAEAADFETRLKTDFAKLSTQLGQMKQRLET
jgi:hypothetical protein